MGFLRTAAKAVRTPPQAQPFAGSPWASAWNRQQPAAQPFSGSPWGFAWDAPGDTDMPDFGKFTTPLMNLMRAWRPRRRTQGPR